MHVHEALRCYIYKICIFSLWRANFWPSLTSSWFSFRHHPSYTFTVLLFWSHGRWSCGTEGLNYQRWINSKGMIWQFHFLFCWSPGDWYHNVTWGQWNGGSSSVPHSKLVIILSWLAGATYLTLQGEDWVSECTNVDTTEAPLDSMWRQWQQRQRQFGVGCTKKTKAVVQYILLIPCQVWSFAEGYIWNGVSSLVWNQMC